MAGGGVTGKAATRGAGGATRSPTRRHIRLPPLPPTLRRFQLRAAALLHELDLPATLEGVQAALGGLHLQDAHATLTALGLAHADAAQQHLPPPPDVAAAHAALSRLLELADAAVAQAGAAAAQGGDGAAAAADAAAKKQDWVAPLADALESVLRYLQVCVGRLRVGGEVRRGVALCVCA